MVAPFLRRQGHEAAAAVGNHSIRSFHIHTQERAALRLLWADFTQTGSGQQQNPLNPPLKSCCLGRRRQGPAPSGQQYTGLQVAAAVAKALPAAKIQPPINASRRYESEIDVQRPQLRAFATAGPAAGGACGLPPAPLNGSLPNVLVIGAIPGIGRSSLRVQTFHMVVSSLSWQMLSVFHT